MCVMDIEYMYTKKSKKIIYWFALRKVKKKRYVHEFTISVTFNFDVISEKFMVYMYMHCYLLVIIITVL